LFSCLKCPENDWKIYCCQRHASKTQAYTAQYVETFFRLFLYTTTHPQFAHQSQSSGGSLMRGKRTQNTNSHKQALHETMRRCHEAQWLTSRPRPYHREAVFKHSRPQSDIHANALLVAAFARCQSLLLHYFAFKAQNPPVILLNIHTAFYTIYII